MPTRQQAIIWTKDGKFIDAYMRHSASMSCSIYFDIEQIFLKQGAVQISLASHHVWYTENQ